MDKVLIVEDNPVLLKILQTGLRKYSDRFEAVTARDGEEAINILSTEAISLLVTDIQMPRVDGLTLLAYMNDHHPEIPCVVMSAHGTPQIKERISRDVLHFIEKPFEIEELVETILPALSQDEPAGTLNGISIANFLQMIHMEQKTCLLEIETPDERKGYFYFEEGVLFDAVYEELNGEEAALAIIPQERAKIRFKNLAKGKKKVSRRIEKGLMVLLMVTTVVYIPIVLPMLLPGVSVNPMDIAGSLIMLMLIPLAIGLFTKARYTDTAALLQPTIAQTSTTSLITLMVLMLLLNFKSIVGVVGTGGIVACILFIAGSFVIGFVLGDPGNGAKPVLGLGTAQRNVSAALVVAGQNFSDPNVIVMVLVGALLMLIILMLTAGELGKRCR